MREQIQKVLSPLVGMPLWSSGRAADLEWFHFGQRRTVTARGRAKEVGEYALHVQCGWRIRHGDQVVVGGRDLYYPAEDSRVPVEDFDWDVKGANRRDKRIAELFQNESGSSWCDKLRSARPEVSRLFSTMSMLWMFFLMTLRAMSTGGCLSRLPRNRTLSLLVRGWKFERLAAPSQMAVEKSP
jgi:hypothetical protein